MSRVWRKRRKTPTGRDELPLVRVGCGFQIFCGGSEANPIRTSGSSSLPILSTSHIASSRGRHAAAGRQRSKVIEHGSRRL